MNNQFDKIVQASETQRIDFTARAKPASRMHTCTHSRVGVLAAVDKTHGAGDQRGASLCVCAPAVDPGRERERPGCFYCFGNKIEFEGRLYCSVWSHRWPVGGWGIGAMWKPCINNLLLDRFAAG